MTQKQNQTNVMQLAVREFLVKHLGADDSGWPASTGIFNKWLLIAEEFGELNEALGIHSTSGVEPDVALKDPKNHFSRFPGDANEVKTVDAICDLLYVIFNLCEELHLNIQPFFDEVHRSNMTKTPAALSPNKKIMKGPDFQPPMLRELLEQYKGVI